MIIAKLISFVRQHQVGTGNTLTVTAGTSSGIGWAGFIDQNFQTLHFTLSASIFAVGVVFYILNYIENRRRTKMLADSIKSGRTIHNHLSS